MGKIAAFTLPYPHGRFPFSVEKCHKSKAEKAVNHRVDRMLGLRIGAPPPHPQTSVYPLWFRGGHTRQREEGGVGPNSDEGTGSMVL